MQHREMVSDPEDGTDFQPRGVQLFDVPITVPWTELDRRYFAFAAGLPSALGRLARDRQMFTGKGGSIEFRSLTELHPLVTCLPWLFQEASPTVSQADRLDITEAGIFLCMGMLLHDAYQDKQVIDQPGIPLLHQQLTIAAQRKLRIMFRPDSRFGSYLDKYFQEYTQALMLEKEHCGRVKAYPLELMYQIGSGKVALLKTVVTALATKAQGEKQIEQLETAIDSLTAAMQLGDDITDWAEDYQSQNYTLPLTRVIPVECWPMPDLSLKEVRQRLEDSLVREQLIIQVVEWFQLAQDVVGELNCPHWMAFVESCLLMTRKYQESIVAKKLLRTLNSHLAFQ
jgi:hypothetical protein